MTALMSIPAIFLATALDFVLCRLVLCDATFACVNYLSDLLHCSL